MKRNISIQNRRLWILINSFALIILVIVAELFINTSLLEGWFWILFLIILIVLLVSFKMFYVDTGLWKHIHKKSKYLDEREAMVLTKAVRLSYTIFVVTVMLIIYAFAVIEKGPIDVVIAGSLIYIAHILPAAIIAWSEKEI